MPKFILDKEEREELADCLEVGSERSQPISEVVFRIIEELKESEAIETSIEIQPIRYELGPDETSAFSI